MFFIYLSRTYRLLFGKSNPPYICHASLWFPLNDTCDCNIWCKYPPTKKTILF